MQYCIGNFAAVVSKDGGEIITYGFVKPYLILVWWCRNSISCSHGIALTNNSEFKQTLSFHNSFMFFNLNCSNDPPAEFREAVLDIGKKAVDTLPTMK